MVRLNVSNLGNTKYRNAELEHRPQCYWQQAAGTCSTWAPPWFTFGQPQRRLLVSLGDGCRSSVAP